MNKMNINDAGPSSTVIYFQAPHLNHKVINMDIQEKCRACLQALDREKRQELFQTWSTPWACPGSLIVNDLSEIANVQILETDNYSKAICLQCFERLKDACLFIVTVRKSDTILKSAAENICTDFSWPRPMVVEQQKSGLLENSVEIEVKQEVLSDTECGADNMVWEEPQMDIKVEPEEIVAPATPPFTTYNANGAISDKETNQETVNQNGTGDKFEEEYLDNTIKQEPVSGDESSKSETAQDYLSMECLLCTKKFNSITGLKAHVISQHSYKTVKRKSDDEAPKNYNEKLPRVYLCSICRKSFKTRTDVMVHETSHGKHACYSCDAKFNSFRQLTRHGKNCPSTQLPQLQHSSTRTNSHNDRKTRSRNNRSSKTSTEDKHAEKCSTKDTISANSRNNLTLFRPSNKLPQDITEPHKSPEMSAKPENNGDNLDDKIRKAIENAFNAAAKIKTNSIDRSTEAIDSLSVKAVKKEKDNTINELDSISTTVVKQENPEETDEANLDVMRLEDIKPHTILETMEVEIEPLLVDDKSVVQKKESEMPNSLQKHDEEKPQETDVENFGILNHIKPLKTLEIKETEVESSLVDDKSVVQKEEPEMLDSLHKQDTAVLQKSEQLNQNMEVHLAINPIGEVESVLLESKVDIDMNDNKSDGCESKLVSVSEDTLQ